MGGMGGWRPYATLIPLILMFNLVDILSIWDDRQQWPTWLPVLTELSSALSIFAFCWLPGLALGLAPLTRPWRRVAMVHLPMALAFAVLHTGGMALLRNLASALFDLDYHFAVTWPVLIYEARKDVMTYLVLCGVFLLFGHGRPKAPASPPAPVPEPASAPPTGPALFDIRDGARLWRVAVADIIAIRAAGNYAEFLMDDGRTLLMRATLTQLSSELAGHGLLRTHRSWLVATAHVRAIAPEGSGDHQITLSNGTNAALSRRFPDALTALRGG